MKTDLEKIGVNVVYPFVKDGQWCVERNGQTLVMAPAALTEAIMSPIIVGLDRLIIQGCNAKGITSPESGFALLYSTEYFPSCDFKLSYREVKYDGWVYDILGENFKNIMEGQAAWLCPDFANYYSDPPKILYAKLEQKDV